MIKLRYAVALAAILFLAAPAKCEPMVASFYGSESGSRTASGARFHPNGLTAAHRTLPFGTRLRVCYRGCVDVVVNDRGPAKWTRRSLDLSRGAAAQIGMIQQGVATVQVERL
jgi:rare lipoprotein A